MQSYVPIYSFNKVCYISNIASYLLFVLYRVVFNTLGGCVSGSRPPSQSPLGVRPVGQEQPGSTLLNTAEYVQEPLCVTLTKRAH